MEKGKFYKLGEKIPKKEEFIPDIKSKPYKPVSNYTRYKIEENFSYNTSVYHKIKKNV